MGKYFNSINNSFNIYLNKILSNNSGYIKIESDDVEITGNLTVGGNLILEGVANVDHVNAIDISLISIINSINIDKESMLRNQFIALQKSDLVEYVPSSNSDLYNVEVVGRKENNTHSLLFEEYNNYTSRNDNSYSKPKLLFNNNTSVKLNN